MNNEQAIRTLEVNQATDRANLNNLAQDVKDLTIAVNELKTTIDKSRGALWVMGWVASFFFQPALTSQPTNVGVSKNGGTGPTDLRCRAYYY